MKKKAFAAFLAILLVLSAYNGYQTWQNIQRAKEESSVALQQKNTGVATGMQAPTFTLEDNQGQQVAVNKDDIGRVYVLNFWASWCPPCRAEMPDMEKFYQEHREKVAFYAINLEEPKDKAAAFIENQGYTFPILFDVNGEVGHLFKVRDIPTTVVVDTDGKIRFRKSGMATKSELEKVLQGIERG